MLNQVVGKSARSHRDLQAHECVESSGEEINRVTGYIGTCESVNMLNLRVGNQQCPAGTCGARVLVVGKFMGLYRDLRFYECDYIRTCELANVIT